MSAFVLTIQLVILIIYNIYMHPKALRHINEQVLWTDRHHFLHRLEFSYNIIAIGIDLQETMVKLIAAVVLPCMLAIDSDQQHEDDVLREWLLEQLKVKRRVNKW